MVYQDPVAGVPPQQPAKRSRAATRDRLLTAAAEVFAERGLSGASVDDIAQAAGFTKGAVYSNYGSKEELFVAAFDQRNRQLMLDAEHALATTSTRDPDSYILQVLDHIAPLDRQWYLLSNEFSLYMLRYPEAAHEGERMRGKYLAEITPMLIEAIARLGREPIIEAKLLVEVVVSVYLGSSGYSPAAHEDPAEMRQVMLSLIKALTHPVDPQPASPASGTAATASEMV